MTPEDTILLAATRQDFGPVHRERVEGTALIHPTDWQSIAATAARHGVAPLVGANLARCGASISPAVAAVFEQALLENAAYKLREAERLCAALRDLTAVGYQILVLKGAALDRLVYREPWSTVSRDLDLVLRPLPGREPGEEGRAVRRALYPSGVECDLDTHHDVTMSGVLRIPFEPVWEDARPLRIGTVEALVMAPEDLLLSLAINACRKRYFRLKSLLDLAESVRHLPLDWSRLGAKARAWGCEAIAYAALTTAEATLGCALPANALHHLGLSSPRRRAIQLLIATLCHRGSLTRGTLIGGTARGRLRGRSLEASLLLVYASLRPAQIARSLAGAFTHLPPELRQKKSPLPAAQPS
jgi:hypothetical protein